MNTQPKLKPLYANLKRLEIGKYLYTREFTLFAIENNIDVIWNDCKSEIQKKSNVLILGYHNTEDDEEAFFLLMNAWYEQNYDTFDEFIVPILINFAKWNPIKLDYTGIISNLKQIGLTKENVLNFTKAFRKIQENKPTKIEEVKINLGENRPNITINTNQIFVVHGRDDKSRLELCNILKDDFNLDPIVLQDKPNNSIDTIISKFERLASECSAAIVLFTPDDDAEGSKRARQNVIFELGYFLGKFQNQENRRIIILKKGIIDIPSDISGVLYLEFTKAVKESYYDLQRQLKHWGYNV